MEVKVFNDYVLPNTALLDNSLDANYYQHVPYLEEFNSKNKTDLTYTVKVHLEPMGAYSKKITKIADLKDKAVIGVPNDPTNESRALQLLAKEGLIKVADKKLLTKNDITENKKNIVIKEIGAEQLPASLPDLDLAVINSNIAIESSDSPYANIIAVKKENKDSEKIKALSKAVTSPEVKKFIEDTYKGAIVATF